jgi:hypothetical protein
MRYVSVDIETTGLDPVNDQILSIGAVIEDTNNILPIEDLPQIHIVIMHERINGSLFAINMHKNLIADMIKYQSLKFDDDKAEYSLKTKTKYVKEDEAVEALFMFMFDNGFRPDKFNYLKNIQYQTVNGKKYPVLNKSITKMYFNIAGKNFGTFDKLFLEKLPKWKLCFSPRSRLIDPALYFVDWKNDDTLPGLELCKDRAGCAGAVAHNAVEDAIDVIKVLRTQYA